MEQVEEGPQIAAPLPEPPTVAAPQNNPSLSDRWVSLKQWSRDRSGMTLEQTSLQPLVFSIKATNGVFAVQIGNHAARWRGAELRLGFQPEMRDSEPFVNELDLIKNIEPLLSQHTMPTNSGRTVVIDPGHGGPSPGTRSVLDGSPEKNFTLDWALRLEPLLASNGWRVFLTRTNDTDLPLPARVAFANECKADLFISLHFNSAAPRREQAGLETFCLTPTGMASTLTREFEDNAALTFTNNTFDVENIQYAFALHESLLKIEGLNDRGVRRARFLGVLRGQNRPAVLIEGGFLSNPAEAERIANPAYRQKLAEAVAAALIDPPMPIAIPAPQILSTHQPSNAIQGNP